MNDGHKKKGQKHQNRAAFKIQFDPLSLEIHKKVSFKGLCKRCADQLQWRMQYNKYNKMTEAAKCTFCHQKNVSRTYMRACEGCWQQKNVCPKCLETETIEKIETRLNQAEQKKQEQESEKRMNDFLKILKERSRRTVKRLFEKGTIEWKDQLQNFVDGEGKTLPLQFRQGFGGANEKDDDNDSDFGDEEGNMSDIDSNSDKELGQEDPKDVKANKKAKKVKKSVEQDLDQEDDEDIDEKAGQECEKDHKVDSSESKEKVKTVEKEEQKSEHQDLAEVKYGEGEAECEDIEEDTEDLVDSTERKVGEGKLKQSKQKQSKQ